MNANDQEADHLPVKEATVDEEEREEPDYDHIVLPPLRRHRNSRFGSNATTTLDQSIGNKSIGDAFPPLVLFYFAAAWCPPCHGFCRQLKQFYDSLASSSSAPRVVFISADRSESAATTYFDREMHADWLALPFRHPATRLLPARFDVHGIPALVVCRADGGLLTTTGRIDVASKRPAEEIMATWRSLPVKKPSAMSNKGFFSLLPILNEVENTDDENEEDDEAENDEKEDENAGIDESVNKDPWHWLPTKLQRADGQKVDAAQAVGGKTIAFFFAAGWCPPCRHFCGKFRTFFETLHSGGHSFAVIFVSSDKSRDEMDAHFNVENGHHPDWLSLPWSGAAARRASRRFGVTAVPTVVIVDAKNRPLALAARQEIASSRDPEETFTGWLSQQI